MEGAPERVFFPAGFPELFSLWDEFPGAVLYAGGTGLIRNQGSRVPALPSQILSLENIDELKRITRTERYLEIGAMVRLSEIINLGKIVPQILVTALESVTGPHIRNIATIGGNLCEKARRLDACAPMAALDAHFELRSPLSARWISASRFSPAALAPRELLTRIRIPLDHWNYSLYKKIKSPDNSGPEGAMVFILKNQKDILTDLRVVYSGDVLLYNRNCETPLIGKRLPLDRKEALNFHESWKLYLETVKSDSADRGIKERPENGKGALFKAQILNFIDEAILGISE